MRLVWAAASEPSVRLKGSVIEGFELWVTMPWRWTFTPGSRSACIVLGEGSGVLVPWTSLHEQFGHGYERIRDFRRVYLRTLKAVKVVYPSAKFDLSEGAMTLWHSRPPVPRRLLPLGR